MITEIESILDEATFSCTWLNVAHTHAFVCMAVMCVWQRSGCSKKATFGKSWRTTSSYSRCSHFLLEYMWLFRLLSHILRLLMSRLRYKTCVALAYLWMRVIKKSDWKSEHFWFSYGNQSACIPIPRMNPTIVFTLESWVVNYVIRSLLNECIPHVRS